MVRLNVELIGFEFVSDAEISYEWNFFLHKQNVRYFTLSNNPTIYLTVIGIYEYFLPISYFTLVANVQIDIAGNIYEFEKSVSLNVTSLGLALFATEDQNDKQIIGISQSFSLEPLKYSIDLDQFPNTISLLKFKFYCRLVNQTINSDKNFNIDFFDLDLASVKKTNILGNNSCFKSTSNLLNYTFSCQNLYLDL